MTAHISRRALGGLTLVTGAALALRPTRTAALPTSLAELPPDPLVLFETGMGGYAQTRIPALCVTPAGTILAFCEGRWLPGDSGDINIIVRRSTDGGQTWSPAKIVLSHAADTAGNPTVVVDPVSGDIVLLSCRNRGTDTYSEIATGTGHARRVYVQRSSDDGATFSAAVEITGQVRATGWRWYATGPGVGAVLTAGPHTSRIVIPANHTKAPTGTDTGAEQKYAGAHLIYSDGGGLPGTWAIGATSSTPDNRVNEDETALTVLPDGQTLYASCRCGATDKLPGHRADATSYDDGATYAPPLFRPQGTVGTAVCQGALLTLPAGRLVYSGPGMPDGRAAMQLWTSTDRGRTWWPAHKVSGLPAAYSSMAMLDPDTIGLLYETGDRDAYERIELERIPVAALTI